MSPTSDPSPEETARLERAVSDRRAQYRAYNRSKKGLARYCTYRDKLVSTVEGRGKELERQWERTRAKRRERIAAHDERIACRS